jgi:hypothetical protein
MASQNGFNGATALPLSCGKYVGFFSPRTRLAETPLADWAERIRTSAASAGSTFQLRLLSSGLPPARTSLVVRSADRPALRRAGPCLGVSGLKLCRPDPPEHQGGPRFREGSGDLRSASTCLCFPATRRRGDRVKSLQLAPVVCCSAWVRSWQILLQKSLGVTTTRRVDVLPDLPTISLATSVT